MDMTGQFLCADGQPHRFIPMGTWFAFKKGDPFIDKPNYYEFICAESNCGISILRPLIEVMHRRHYDSKLEQDA